jgi:hypothetical protein
VNTSTLTGPVVYRLTAAADEQPAHATGCVRLLPAARRRAESARIERRARLARATGAAIGAGLIALAVVAPLLAIACMVALAVAGLAASAVAGTQIATNVLAALSYNGGRSAELPDGIVCDPRSRRGSSGEVTSRGPQGK